MKQLSQRQSQDMAARIGGLSSKSEKIRALAQAGFQQSDIGRFLNIRPQFVSNVVRAERKKVESEPSEDNASTIEQQMTAIVEGLDTKSAKIRALDEAGYSRSQIAKFIDIRYQHVRNVLVQDQQIADAKSVNTDSLKSEWVQVAPDGRVVIPAAFRRALGVEGGGHVMMTREAGRICLIDRDTVIKDIQDRLAPKLSQGPSLVDELIAERRAEASRE